MKALPLVLIGLLAGCGSTSAPQSAACSSDLECDDGKLCFAEGCGDPNKGIVVEVEGGSLTGQFARDFALPSGTLGANQNFELGQALSLNGQFLRAVSTLSPLERSSYTEAVVVRAVGQSMLLPGITRSFEGRFEHPERGFFEMKVGAGDFTITATPADRVVPPAVTMAQVGADTGTPSITFAFPSVDGAPALAGQLIRKLDTTLAPPEPLLVSEPFTRAGIEVPVVELQLFDPTTNLPLSQRFPIASTTGEFAVIVSPEARTRTSLLLVAAPREPGVPIPTRRFLIDTPLPAALSLEYGDYGAAATATGTIVDSQGVAVAGAQVVLEGTVAGDGTFRSKIVETNAAGEFSLLSLGSKAEGSFTLSVVPPRGSRAAYSQRPVTVKVANGAATLSPDRLSLEDRLVARGQVQRPGGDGPAQGVTVRATLQLETKGNTGDVRALPVEPAEAITADDGTFEMPLDPGKWRFEYFPAEVLPLASRLVTIKAVLDPQSGQPGATIDLPLVQLSAARAVSGLVTGTMGTQVSQAVPYSQLRFFRVTTVEGKPASILLGSTISDDRGRYSVVLPTASATLDGGSR